MERFTLRAKPTSVNIAARDWQHAVASERTASHLCAQKPFLAVLMTCFNRRSETLRCLEAIYGQMGLASFDISVVVVDDASTDDTAEAVRARFPEVIVMNGNGNLFWNRGMRLAFEKARENDADAYLWLNDDTILFPDALNRLVSTWKALERQGKEAIVTGSTCDRTSGQRTYGGFQWKGTWRKMLIPVQPSDGPLTCDTMNGNCTLIPRRIAEVIGNLDPSFHHSFGDMDYGFRARAKGFQIYVAPGFVGTCSDNSAIGTWRDRTAGFKRRWRHLNSPKGSPFSEWRLYCRRHLGPLWPLYAVSPYVKTLVTTPKRPRPEVDVA